jgi:hypothetical protein
MIAAAKRVRPRRDGHHPYERYFLLWTAFNSIYTTIAHRKGLKIQLKVNPDGSIATIPNGNVNIPEVEVVPEREQIRLAFGEFSEGLKHQLILHKGTEFFVKRTPFWEGIKIKKDAFGQSLNGVIRVNYTTDSQYPVWSPIDSQVYEAFLRDPESAENRDFLGWQIIELLFTIRENFMYAGKKFDDANDISVVENALPLLELILSAFTR